MESIKPPSQTALKAIADTLGINLSDELIAVHLQVIKQTLAAYQSIEKQEALLFSSSYARHHIHEPTSKDNPYNAWYVKAMIEGAKQGKLKGKTLAIKDNTNVAGLPMMNGAASLENHIPSFDATIVNRILAAGGTILGKAHCECFCFSGSSFTNAKGPVLNPHKPSHSSGGSSSGCAVLVANGEVDMATGGDQGGSIRIPASWSGICGMKPTYGLVPYTGIMPIEYTLDHTGPMTKTLADNALLLEVLAGFDEGLDTRQPRDIKSVNYTEALGKSINGMKIGVLKEGFGRSESQKEVDESVRQAVNQYEKLGAECVAVSCPMHLEAASLWTVIAIDGAYDRMMCDDGYGSNDKGLYDIDLMKAHHGWRDKVNSLSDTMKFFLLLGQYSKQNTHGVSYAKAQNRVRALKEAYDALLEKVDVLLMPTTPMQPHRLPDKETSVFQKINMSLEMTGNTCPFNLTGHPALSMPCGMHDGLPIGMMLVGREFEESTVYQIAHAFEQSMA